MELDSVVWPWPWMLAGLVILATVCIGLSKGLFSLPILGDSIQLKQGPRDFLLDRLARYGDPFTFYLMPGKKITVLSSPEAVKFVLLTSHASFQPGYAKQVSTLLGEGKFGDARHAHFKRAVLSINSGEGLLNVVPFISSLAEKTIKSWENQKAVNTVEEMEKFVFAVGMHTLWANVEPYSEEMLQIKSEITTVTDSLAVVPINFPGFSFYKSMKTRKVLVARIQREITRRRQAGSQQNDLMDILIRTTEFEVTDHDIVCVMLAFLFASYVTTSALLSWILKYLDDFPEVRQRVQDEQDGYRQKVVEDKSFSWFRVKSSMPYTLQVINEILRVEVLVPFIPRRAKNDVDYNGLVIPKDSTVWASISSTLNNQGNYPNPREFNPSRFEEKPKANAFTPFGQGPHICPGNELAITEAMFMIHHLITNYSWERCGPDSGVTPFPVRRPTSYPIRLIKRSIT